MHLSGVVVRVETGERVELAAWFAGGVTQVVNHLRVRDRDVWVRGAVPRDEWYRLTGAAATA